MVLARVTGKPSGLSRTTGGSGGGFRVGTGTQVFKWINESFGVDPSRIGNLTPEQVRETAKRAQEMKKQVHLAKAYAKHFDSIVQCTVIIEKLRAEAIQKGLKAKEEIDKYVSQALLDEAKHSAHIKKILQDTQGAIGVIEAQSRSDMQVSRSRFQQQLRTIAMRQQASMQNIQATGRDQQQQAQAATRLAESRRRFDGYINARDTQGKQYQTGGGWFGGWFR